MIELDDLLQATGGLLQGGPGARRFTDLAFDSRRLGEAARSSEEGTAPLFVAVKSDTGDGHDYITEALERGAVGVLCQRTPVGLPPGVTCILVKDTRQALLDWARLILQKFGTEVIAVTGSSGKTVTKEAIAAVLATQFSVFKNPGSYSGRFGLPIALGLLEPTHRFAVLEVAADSLNEVHDLARLTRPVVGVVTTVNGAHIDSLGSIEAIEREKGSLLEALPPEGLAVVNRDDPRVYGMRARTQARVVSYGIPGAVDSKNPDALAAYADYVACNLSCTPQGVAFDLFLPTAFRSPDWERRAVSLRLMGRHHVYAALAAIAVGCAYAVPPSDILGALAALEPVAGRLRPVPGRNGTVLLDDSYDAALADTLAALDALSEHFPQRRRIAVLGSLRGSADDSEDYRQVGQRAAQAADELVLKGEASQATRLAALSAGMDAGQVFSTYTNEEAARHLAQETVPGDVVLIKGAREERLEEIAAALMRDPELAPELLVRQEAAFREVRLALPERPTWLEVDLEAVASNLRLVRQIVGDGVAVMAVLKADGYGHGAIRIARTAMNNGAQMLGVACLSEGVTLRRSGIAAPILVLGYTPAWQAREAVIHDIALTVFDRDTVGAASRAGREVGRTARVHVKVDSGMGRLGLLPDRALPLLQYAATRPNLEVEGLFTHFSVADEADKTYTYWQLRRFVGVLDQARGAGIAAPIVHSANSAATFGVPEARFNMVRVGIALYGLAPGTDAPLPPGFRPALSFKTRVAQVKVLPPGSYVSYGNAYQAEAEIRIAVIPVGYADGFRRSPATWKYVLVKGQQAVIVGRVCMDQTMIDVTHVDGVRQGDEVVLIGQQGQASITAEMVADWLGTIGYEVVSEILARVPRVS